MIYLTYAEYKDLQFPDITETEFDKLLPKASAILDNVTNQFFQRIDITKYNSWTVGKFQQALCSQIEYFNELGATTFEKINSSPQSFTAGRTSVSKSSRYSNGGVSESKSLVAEDVFVYLQGTGLLYSGVSVR